MKTRLKIDKRLCRVILSNKKVFGPLFVRPIKETRVWGNHLRTTVSGKQVKFYLREDRQSVGAHPFCLGSGNPMYFAGQVKLMTHLSQFLMTYSAWLAKKNG